MMDDRQDLWVQGVRGGYLRLHCILYGDDIGAWKKYMFIQYLLTMGWVQLIYMNCQRTGFEARNEALFPVKSSWSS